MLWCPKCGAEYRDGFEICADCNVNFVNQNPTEINTTESKEVQPFHWLLLTTTTLFAAALFIAWNMWFWNGGSQAPLYYLPALSCITGFALGLLSKSASSVIAISFWALFEIPLFILLICFGANDPSAENNLICLVTSALLLSPVLLGPYSTFAGAQFGRTCNKKSLLSWVITVLIVISLLLIGIHFLN